MKTVLFLAGLVAVALATETYHFETKSVNEEFILRQKKVFGLLNHVTEVYEDAEYYKIGLEYNIESNFEFYTNKKAVEEFLYFYKAGMLQKNHIFSVFYEKMREEAIALYHLFFYAKDFETFYKTACWARVHLNEGLFTYAFTIAVTHRPDTVGIVLPAPYEIYPYFFVNSEIINKMYRVKLQKGLIQPEFAAKYGIVLEDNAYTFYANYSGWWSYENEEQKLSYFTEDIGLNSYYYYFHTSFPFWMNGEDFTTLKEHRGEYYFFFYKQLLVRYYMERLTNGLGEIPEFSWRQPFKTGYSPNLMYHNFYPFQSRPDFYEFQTPENYFDVEYVENYEKQFLGYLEQGSFKAYNYEIDLKSPKSSNFVGNFWQSNYDLYKNFGSKNYNQYYDIIARNILGAGPEPWNPDFIAPVALEQFQTALRDPAFYQLYKRVMYYFLQYKQYLEPYTKEYLHFNGVKVNHVNIDKLVTYFDFFDWDATNGVFFGKEEHKASFDFRVRQPRIAHKPFDVKIEVESTVATSAVIKFFLAPKYDSKGFPISLENNWMNFYELDFFKYNLVAGKNSIVRNSEDFAFFKEDPLPSYELLKLLESGKVPVDMSENYFFLPQRLMLPKGTPEGFPFQFFVIVYPQMGNQEGVFGGYFTENKSFGWPFDRPLYEYNFDLPNMFFEDVYIYHEGESYAYFYNIPGYKVKHNAVPKN